MWRSTLAIAAGRVGEAERLIADFAAIGARTADRNALLYAEIQRFVLAMMGFGEPPAIASLERERDRPADYAYRAGYAWLLAARRPGRRGPRARRLDRRRRLGPPRRRHEPPRGAGRDRARDRAHGDAAPAAGAYDRLAPYADRNVVNARGAGGYGSAELPLGLLADAAGAPRGRARAPRARRRSQRALGAGRWAAAARRALEALDGR